MLDNSVLAGEVLRHGAYVCLRLADGADARAVAGAAIPALAETLGLQNEFAPAAGPPSQSIAFLRRHGATPGALADDGVAQADAVVHVAAPTASPVSDFCAEATRLLGALARLRVIGGVVRPRTYTGAAMNNFAYAHQVVQQPGRVMPNAFLVPMNKIAAWWAKDWMERHTYFLPRYDDEGRMKSEGHALADVGRDLVFLGNPLGDLEVLFHRRIRPAFSTATPVPACSALSPRADGSSCSPP